MYKILTLNNISLAGLERFPRDCYELGSEISKPHGILLRSYKMHDMVLPDSVMCIGRAGAGVNNIPVEAMTARGIPVFNAPGANANAVKELVLAGMLLASRNICPAWAFSQHLEGDDAAISQAVEQGKKTFVGSELAGRTLGVIGLGAIGRLVANMALSLGMKVIGYDPGITVQGAWQLSSKVAQAANVDDLVSKVDFLSFHVPLIDATRHMIDAGRMKIMKDGMLILNFARAGIVDDAAMIDALNAGKIKAYVCDFPNSTLKKHANVIALPHLGASTVEAEDNCAVMVAEQVRDYLENGNITNSVNFPSVLMPRTEGYRLTVANRNVPNMVGQMTTHLAQADLNIIDMLNRSIGDIAYTLVDVDNQINAAMIEKIKQIDGVLNVRVV